MRIKTLTLVAFALAGAITGQAAAQSNGKAPWNSFADRVESARNVGALSNDLFGDQIGLQHGTLSFSATDVSIPGNSALPVALTRRYQVKDWRHRVADGMFKDWEVELPHVSATFASEWIAQHGPPITYSAARCSNFNRPPIPAGYPGLEWKDFWHGMQISIPGVTSGELLSTHLGTQTPTSGGPYRWMTNDQVHVSCLSTIKNGSGAYGGGGEGFLAVAPDGTKYWFDWMARSPEPPLRRGTSVTSGTIGPLYWSTTLPVHRYSLYVTRVEDRFGNAVEYTYSNAWNQPARLTSIKDATGGEGRQITLSYTGGAISSVTDGTRTWNYTYGTTGSGRGTLTSVTQVTPDNPGSNVWSINFAQFTNAEIIYSEVAAASDARNCFMLQPPTNETLSPVGTITHPSGAVGTFTMKLMEHNRANVPINCANIVIPSGHGVNDETDDVPHYPFSFLALTLQNKQISGPNLASASWNYYYNADRSDELAYGATRTRPQCRLDLQTDCMKPVCVADACAGASRTLVVGPDDEWVHYTHGNAYRYNEGLLTAVHVGKGGVPAMLVINHGYGLYVTGFLRRTRYTYDLSYAASPTTPGLRGSGWRMDGDSFQDEYRRPGTGHVITQQGVDFSRTATLDAFDRPVTEVKASVGGSGTSRTDTTEYHDNFALWVLGQVSRTTANGLQTSRTVFNGMALPVEHRGMNDHLIQKVSYHALGYPHTIEDGKANVTSATLWYRGMPGLVTQADTHTIGATINGLGWILNTTDQNGFVTAYDYDSVGRLKKVTYPTGDTVAWNDTHQQFSPLAVGELGFAAGTWRREVRTGNGYQRTYYDALWRPVMQHEFDFGNIPGTSRYHAWAYDHDGRKTFEAYPVASATGIASLTEGVWTEYDVLGRATSVTQDAELPFGTLVTLNAYLSGFQTRVTPPRGFPTTTLYQTFDTPDTSAPLQVQEPLGRTTVIARDLLGRTTSLQRTDPAYGVGGTTVTRSYVYDVNGRLCKLIEPETGATVMDYDLAGNLAWSAAGLTLTSPAQSSCAPDRVTAHASGRRVDRLYSVMNRMTTLMFPDQNGNQLWDYTPDGQVLNVHTWNENATTYVYNSYTYNKRRLMTAETAGEAGWYTWGLGYSYNANGHLSAQSYPTGLAITYLPNALGQPTQAGSYATGVQYYPNGAIKQFTYGNGLVHTMLQNARQLPESSNSTGGALSLRYSFDANGNVAAIDDLLDANRDRTMTYDALDRLIEAESVSFGGDHKHRFSYDLLDNLRSWKLAGVKDFASYEYDASNRLVTIRNTGGTALHGFTYDVQGNLATKGSEGFTFDFGNRLRQYSGTVTEIYTYDAHGRRNKVARNDGTHALWQYSNDGQMLFGFRGPTTQTTHEYIYLSGSLVATVDHNWPSNSIIATNYQHTDALGSPAATTDASGAVLDRAIYDPYGGSGFNAGGVGFAGHVVDDSSALIQMQQRYYDAAVGRFLSTDPVTTSSFNGGNFNRYWYANNNPYKFIDPDGRESGCITVGTNCGFGGVSQAEINSRVSTVVDFTPIVGDIKGVVEAIREPTAANIAAAAVGFVPVIGDGVGKAIKAGSNITEAAADSARASTLAPGPHAGESIPVNGPGRANAGQQAEINRIGQDTGCHTCGATSPGTASGNHVLDHQPPSKLNPSGGEQRGYPHCIDCSRRQGGEVNAARRRASESK